MKNDTFSLYTYKSKYDYTPLVIIIIYLNITYLFHVFLNDAPSIRGMFFMFFINLSIIVGYILPNSTKEKPTDTKTGLHSIWKKNINVNRVILLCSIITILTSINTILSFYPNSSEILYYLKNPGKAYVYTKMAALNDDGTGQTGGFGSIATILFTLLSATKYIFFMFAILYWKQLNKRLRLVSFFTIIVYFVTAFLVGAMITIGTILIPFVSIFIINMKRKKIGSDLANIIFKKPKRLKYFLLALFGVFIILFFMSNRVSEDNNLAEGVKFLGFYISHGYEGLDHCLELPFESTYGFTSFRGISTLLVKYLGIPDLFQNSYLMRNEIANNYPSLSIWSTIFPWLASDFSFYAIPVIMLFISSKFSFIWNMTLRTGNPYGYVLLGQFFIFWFMIPANNQLFHTLGNAASFILIYYLYSRSKKYYELTNV